MKADTQKLQIRLLRAMSHPFRLQILNLLAEEQACVCDLVLLTERHQPYVSQQLAKLRAAGLVTGIRDGRRVQYRLSSPEVAGFLKVFQSMSMKIYGLDPSQEGSESTRINGTWHGIPRAEIDWSPTIEVDYCTGCGLCATSCARGVYAYDYDRNKPVVVDPTMCMVGCTSCAMLCPQDAVELPSRGYIHNLVKKENLLRQSKIKLHTMREKYDVQIADATTS